MEQNEILRMIDSFLGKHNLCPTTFGKASIGDGNLIRDLKKGRSLTMKTFGRIEKYMNEYGYKRSTSNSPQKHSNQRQSVQ